MAYRWNIKDIEAQLEQPDTMVSTDEKDVYREMIADYSHQEQPFDGVNVHQFRKALNHFRFSAYKNEIDAILYFGNQLLNMELKMPEIKRIRYREQDVVSFASTYMRRKEPNDFGYYKKVVGRKNRIHFDYLASEDTFLGKSYFLSEDEYYLYVHRVGGMQDSVTLLHESCHIENYLKYGLNLSSFYAELAPMTREHYAFDLLRTYGSEEEVEKERFISLNHYFAKIMKLYEALLFLNNLKKNKSFLRQNFVRYDEFYECFDVPYLYGLLTGMMEQEIGYALSFMASLDIYNHSAPERSNLFITSYQIGTRTVTPKVIDRVLPYLTDEFKPYQKVKK